MTVQKNYKNLFFSNLQIYLTAYMNSMLGEIYKERLQ